MPRAASGQEPSREGSRSLYLPQPQGLRSFMFVPSTFWPQITRLWMIVSSSSPTLFSTKSVNELVSWKLTNFTAFGTPSRSDSVNSSSCVTLALSASLIHGTESAATQVRAVGESVCSPTWRHGCAAL